MKNFKLLSTICSILILLIGGNGCTPVDSVKTPTTDNSNIAVINAKIYTVNPKQPLAQAVVIKNKRIIFVGTTVGAQEYIDADVKVVDAGGRLVLPGLHDVHLHPLEAGSSIVSCVLDSTLSIEDQEETISDCAEDEGANGWVLGWGHSLEELQEDGRNPKEILDELIPDRPVVIMEETSHSVWVNSKALIAAGINKNTPAPQGGAILHTNSQPNGILLDTAGDLIFDIAYAPNKIIAEKNYKGLIHSLGEISKNGITSLVNARVYWKRGNLDVWKRVENEGLLTARTVQSLWAYPLEDDTKQLLKLKSLYSNDPDRLMRVSQIKFYSDGIIHNSTAAMLEPYKQYFAEVGKYGLNYFTQSRLTKYVSELELAGFDMHIHAIGSRAVRESLNSIESAIEKNGDDLNRRHRLTHVELVDAEDRSRFNSLGVTADFQVAGDFTLPDNHKWQEPQIGTRYKDLYPVRDIYNIGALVTLSSDWDVSKLNPFVGMQNALELDDQSLPNIDAVIKAYTLNGAYVMRQEQDAGSIEVGKFGDLIIVDQDVTSISVNSISNTKVLLTLLGGKTVYTTNSL